MSAGLKAACVVLAVAIAGPPAGWSGSARAQDADVPIIVAQAEPEPERRGPGLFRFLFGGNRQRNNRSEQRETSGGKSGSVQKKARRKAVARAPAAVVAVEKAADAKRVLVVGDFMAKALAKGLGEAFAENADIIVIDASNGSSGLVRDDFYDWNAHLPEIASSQNADLVVVMIGANDRQDIRATTGRIAKRTAEWSMTYARRVDGFIKTIAATGKPSLWVGLVPVKSNALSRDYSVFNSIYREKTDAAGITFVATWNGFADDEGRYVASGPDINGQQRGLRTQDGLNFTRTGRRKLAFFVERDVLRLLKSDAIAVLTALTPDATPDAVEPQRVLIGPMVPIDAVSLAGNSELSSFATAADARPGAAIETIVSDMPAPDGGGETQTAAPPWPPAGRADDFSWPGPQ